MNISTKFNNIEDDFIEQYLIANGIKDIEKYLNPTPNLFEKWQKYSNIEKACSIFNDYVNRNITIGIVMDSDQDGTCSAALIYNFLQYLNFDKSNIKVYYHTAKQHGLKDLLDKILIENGKDSLLIVPDAGSNDKEECFKLKEAGIEVIVLDHHVMVEDNIYATIVNNQIPEVENKELSGTGVTDKFVRAYCDIYQLTYPNYCDLVAVSLVSDVCSLTPIENRTYMYYGLSQLSNPFLSFLFKKLCTEKEYNSNGIGWKISPLANALARSDEQETKKLFFDGLIGAFEPEEALKKMRKVKRVQDAEVKEIVNEIEPKLDFSSKTIIGFTEPTNASFLGLIANKFTGKYNKPTILLRESNSTTWSGSLRSPIPLLTKINESGLAKAQGHEEACGVFIKKSNLPRFEKWLNNLDLSDTSIKEVCAEVEPKDITMDLCKQIEINNNLWGHGLPSPTFYIKTIVSQNNIFIFKKSTTTIKIDINGLGCLKFFSSDQDAENFSKYDNFEIEMIVGNLGVNEYNGFVSPQCEILDYEIKETNFQNEEKSWEDLF